MFLALGLLDMLMDKCGTTFHQQIGTKDFMQVLIAILNSKDIPREVKHLSILTSFSDPAENRLSYSKVGLKIRDPLTRTASALLRCVQRP